MGYEVERLREDILYFRVYDVVTMVELFALIAAAQAQFDTATRPMHMVGNTLDLKRYPTHLHDLRKVFAFTPDQINLGYYVIITQNKLLYFLMGSLASVFVPHIRLKPVRTREAAFAFIDSLPSSPNSTDTQEIPHVPPVERP